LRASWTWSVALFSASRSCLMPAGIATSEPITSAPSAPRPHTSCALRRAIATGLAGAFSAIVLTPSAVYHGSPASEDEGGGPLVPRRSGGRVRYEPCAARTAECVPGTKHHPATEMEGVGWGYALSLSLPMVKLARV